MIIWCLLVGFLLGEAWPNSGDLGGYLGGLAGLFAGLALRWVVRREVASQIAASQKILKAELSAQLRQGGLAPPSAPAQAAAQASVPLNLDDGLLDNERSPAPPLAAPAARPASAALPSAPPTAPTAPTAPRAPATPNGIEIALGQAKAWLLGGNTIVRVGLVILFIGLTFLARYAAVAGLFPVELRLATVGAAGIALLAIGFAKRLAKPGFALALQGAGVAVMYLTVFAAFRLYGLVPALPAFGLMVVVCALSCALALLQNSRALAVVAFAGGFAVPVLLSTGQGSHISLFGYYSVLNVALAFIAYRRSWRLLNVLGFVATFGVATAWGVLKYAPENYATAQAFLIFFILIYVLTAVLYARSTPTQLGNAVDSTLVFGTPLVGFGLQAGLVQSFELGTAFSALGFGAVYLGLAAVLANRAHASYRLLVECFIALGVGFATLAVPLGLDAQWTSAVWALEGAGAFWVGMRQARWMPRAFGLALQGVALVAFALRANDDVSNLPFLNPAVMGALLIALPAMLLAWWLRNPLAHSGSGFAKAYSALEARLPTPLFVYGFIALCCAWLFELSRTLPPAVLGDLPVRVWSQSTTQLLAMVSVLLSAAAAQAFGLAKSWVPATLPARVSVWVMALALLGQSSSGFTVLQWPALLVWPLTLALHYVMLRFADRAPDAVRTPFAWARVSHAVGVWLVTALLADGLWFWIEKGQLWGSAWASVTLLISAIACLGLLTFWAGRASDSARLAGFSWPLKPFAEAYFWRAAVPLAALVFVGALAVALASDGAAKPLPYVPLLNPTDLSIALGIGALLLWRRVVASAQPAPTASRWVQGQNATWAIAALAFIAINTVWLRVAHHFFAVPWNVQALYASFVVQTGYALLWTLLALTVMVLAHRQARRTLWVAGAALLGLVVVKLLLVDLSNVGGVERIVVFIAVGVLMLVVGYFAPLPPASPALKQPVAAPSNEELS